MFTELETAVLAHDLKDHNLTRGDVGTVVHCYAGGKAYEIEFITGEGKPSRLSRWINRIFFQCKGRKFYMSARMVWHKK